jgi:hypothetical protein
MGMNLTIGMLLLWLRVLIKYLVRWLKIYFFHCWQYGSNIIFGILASFTSQCKTIN